MEKERESDTITSMADLAPGSYNLSAGQYQFTVATAPVQPTESPDKTTVPPSQSIVDSNLDTWTLVSGVVQKNGAPAGYSANVTQLAYVTKQVWQTNASGGWWYWNGSTWVAGTNPINPNPPTGGLAGKLSFFGGTADFNSSTPSGGMPALVNNPYTQITQPSQGGLSTVCTTTIDQFNWTAVDNQVNHARSSHLRMVWYCGFVSWAQGNGFPANYGYSGARLVTWFNNFMSQAAARYPDLSTFCYFNYCNEALALNKNGTGNWDSAFGGNGATGVDWIINTGKVVRKYFPTAKIGVNDFNYEDTGYMHMYGGGPSNLSYVLSKIPAMKSAGVLDWIGMEGYNLDSQTTSGLTSALNQVGALVPVIYTEFSPGSYDCFWQLGNVNDPPQNDNGTYPPQQSNQVAAWKRLLQGILVPNPNCIGVVGSWWREKSSGHCGWLVDDTVSPPRDTPAMTWLKSYVPGLLK